MNRRALHLFRALVAALALSGAAGSSTPAAAQLRWRDLAVSMGSSVEAYAGNFSSVIVPVVDSTDRATAVGGEVALRGAALFSETRTRSFEVSFDGGLRQAAAMGFRLRDYAPREWVGSLSGRYTQSVGSWGNLLLQAGVRGRSVRDRPPTPLFLQPGYATVQGGVGVVTRPFDGVTFDAQVDLEHADYRADASLPQLDFLDRTSSGIEAGVRWGSTSTMRFYGGFRWTDYSNLGTFDPEDPFRRDHTARVGLEWTYPGEIFAQVGVDGTVNRSNSNRPE
ncbi:MAG: hypothetical protein FIA95_00230, partial [Gemmatimonadetes bacterium]|nr:hypothetical protein [Gemmatimonadota bacterium]